MTCGKIATIVVCLVVSSSSNAQAWMDLQEKRSLGFLLQNISPTGTAKGSIVASPSKKDPDYFYHWIRDAALVMRVVVEKYGKESGPLKVLYSSLLEDYLKFSKQNQRTANLSDGRSSGRLGEPKFHVDGTAYNQEWGRPQNDGPALRALVLISLANQWLKEKKDTRVQKELYDGQMPSFSPIKTDLEFVSHHWEGSSFDIWEEISGKHFYNRLIYRRALVEGAALAERLGDGGAAVWYRDQAGKIEKEIEKHWDASRGVILPTLDRDAGIAYKKSDIDSAVLLGILHGQGTDGYYSVTHSRVLSTLEKAIQSFDSLYPVNRKGYGAVAVGRYPEDRYDGLKTDSEGNPWFLTTAAVAELHYRIAKEVALATEFRRDSLNSAFLDALGVTRAASYSGEAKKDLVTKIHKRGDAFLSRACFHGFEDGRLSEQMNRYTGFMQGAPNLTWSYASFLTAFWHR